MTAATEEFNTMLSLASAWVEEQEQIALRDGSPLNTALSKDAAAVGVAHPERVRVLKLPQVPLPAHPVLQGVCEKNRAITSATWALSARYGIFVRTDRCDQREDLVHELVHTSQYEKLGGIRPFLEKYLRETLAVGFPHGAMEQEAIVTAARICAGVR